MRAVSEGAMWFFVRYYFFDIFHKSSNCCMKD